MKDQGKDRRRFSRLPVDVRVRVLADTKGRPIHSFGRGHDLSEGGMALYVPLDLKTGQQIKLEFELPHARMKFGIRCVVRNTDGYRYGIEFVALSPAEKEALHRAVTVLALTAERARASD